MSAAVKGVAKVKFHYAKRIGTNVVGNRSTITYEVPELLEYNVKPLSGSSDYAIYGSRTEGTYKAVVNNTQENRDYFSKFDLAYLEGADPTGEVADGANATHFVSDVRPFNLSLHIIFERLSSRK